MTADTLIDTLAVVGALCLAGSAAVVAVLWLASRADDRPRPREAWLVDATLSLQEAEGNLVSAGWAAQRAGLDVRAEVDAALEATRGVRRVVREARERAAA